MFGYIRPLKGELKVKEYEKFKAAYCGLCHSMRKNYGLPARFLINYDLTFMAMLLSEQKNSCFSYGRCIVSPFKKKCFHSADPAFDHAAAYGVILSYWKLRDSIADESLVRSIGARAALILLRCSYKRAAHAANDFDRLVRKHLSELRKLEEEGCKSLDMTADQFAKITQAVSFGIEPESKRRAIAQIFYHTGRIVYILDAADDLKEDIVKDLYNPIKYRFNNNDGILSQENKDELLLTLRHSENLIISAFQLLDEGPWSDILENILYLGIPQVALAVLSGRWRKPRRNET